MILSFQDIFSQAKVARETETSPCSFETLKTEKFNPDDTRPEETAIANPRVFQPVAGSFVNTENITFDALYTLAIREMEDNAVYKIKDGNFNQGNEFRPGNFPFGSLFSQAGTSWTYVWTRDTAYSVHLALAAISPQTALNSLMFKTSPDRNGNNRQIVQDTGTGGSYPISSDRVVWALAAEKLLHYLAGEQRATFQTEAFEIVKNTIEHDRQILFEKDEAGHDKADGLYSGEQSFLDWRQQTYPGWMSYDVVHVGMSKCLSTNLLHLNILSFAADLAKNNGANDLAKKYQGWADNLKQAIRDRLYLPDTKLYSTFITTFLDNSPAYQYDLLGSVLAILLDVATPEQSKDIIANYPVLPYGPPVIWPQQQYTKIYHNRAIWPFVTAYWVKAAKKVENVAAVNHGIKSLIQGVIRYRSNRENLEMISGITWFKDDTPQEFRQVTDDPTDSIAKSNSGPAVCSQAQLWSIAGYLSMVHDVIFGLDTSNEGIRFLPYITTEIRNDVFSETNSLTLSNFQYQGKTIHVTVNLPNENEPGEGRYTIDSIKLNDQIIPKEDQEKFIQSDRLQSNNQIDIQLSPSLESASSDNLIKITDTDWHNSFAPRFPVIQSVTLDPESGKIQVTFQPNGPNKEGISDEKVEDISFNIYRNGKLLAKGLPGSTSSWLDSDTNESSQSYCYTVENYYHSDSLQINNHSQKSQPYCYWGKNSQRVETKISTKLLLASSSSKPPTPNREKLKNGFHQDENGQEYFYYENWGYYEDILTLEDFQPLHTGSYLLQVSAANGANGLNTGITCAVKYIQVFDQTDTSTSVGSGYLIMPHTRSWVDFKDSSFVRVNKLEAGRTYKIVISENEYTFNMSHFDHFKIYNGQGGKEEFNRVNIASLKILALNSELPS